MGLRKGDGMGNNAEREWISSKLTAEACHWVARPYYFVCAYCGDARR